MKQITIMICAIALVSCSTTRRAYTPAKVATAKQTKAFNKKHKPKSFKCAVLYYAYGEYK